MESIRNFCIIAHIDHGKSTLADRLLEHTGTIQPRDMTDQLLDDMDLERERGITIKSHAVQMAYLHEDVPYELNLIDTPGHVDFSYEVSRAIASCEGALLVVDAAQGVEAQTISNLYLALEHELAIIPVLNKVDLPGAMVEEVKEQIKELTGCGEEEIVLASAKTGQGVADILERIVLRIPAPKGDEKGPLQAMIFDSAYNPYRGVVVLFRVFSGVLRQGDRVMLMSSGAAYCAEEVGSLKIKNEPQEAISTGSVGYLISGLKSTGEVKVGDTITHVALPAARPIKGFEDVKPMIFAGVYPTYTGDFELLRGALEKLQLNDASLVWEPETSKALGFGFRCGFLGMLHMEIVQERLEREFGVSIILTVPSVRFQITKKNGESLSVSAPADLPEAQQLQAVEEPYIHAKIITMAAYIGNIITLCVGKRGTLTNQAYLTSDRVELQFMLPLAEVVFDFYDKLKTLSRGYASFDYEFLGYQPAGMVKLDILLNKERVDALSCIVHKAKAYEWGKRLCVKLSELIPRQMFEVAIQAAIGSKVIARETVRAVRKNVLAKCYGGDITRKRKLLEKQKRGKKKMRNIGSVEVPQEAFKAVLRLD